MSQHVRLELNGPWRMRSTEDNSWVDAHVPGTVYSDLLAAGLVPDAYYRAEESAIQAIFDKDYEYTRTFTVDQQLLDRDEVTLCCEGLDTLATVTVNGTVVATTDNMHRTYRVPILDVLRLGENEITISFGSPVRFAQGRSREPRIARTDAHPKGRLQLRVGLGTEPARLRDLASHLHRRPRCRTIGRPVREAAPQRRRCRPRSPLRDRKTGNAW